VALIGLPAAASNYFIFSTSFLYGRSRFDVRDESRHVIDISPETDPASLHRKISASARPYLSVPSSGTVLDQMTMSTNHEHGIIRNALAYSK
jgi:hypothetical protein